MGDQGVHPWVDSAIAATACPETDQGRFRHRAEDGYKGQPEVKVLAARKGINSTKIRAVDSSIWEIGFLLLA